MTKSEFAKKVWDTLSKKDIIEYIEYLPKTAKRPEIPYLSWVSAWTLLKSEFPQSTFEYSEDKHMVDQSVEVGCVVNVIDGDDCISLPMRLGVMDFNFGAIASPDARAINDTRQRCLTKCIAMHGLGLQLWTKDAKLMPVGKGEEPIGEGKKADKLKALIEKAGVKIEDVLKWSEVETIEEIPRMSYNYARNMLLARINEQ